MFGSSAPYIYALAIIKKKERKLIVKKIVMIVAMVLATSFSANAAETKTDLFGRTQIERYELKVNNTRIAKVLELDDEQTKFLELFHNKVNKNLCDIYQNGGSDLEIKDELESDTRMLSYWLDRKQHRKYLEMLNLTFRNRGFDFTIPFEWRKK